MMMTILGTLGTLMNRKLSRKLSQREMTTLETLMNRKLSRKLRQREMTTLETSMSHLNLLLMLQHQRLPKIMIQNKKKKVRMMNLRTLATSMNSQLNHRPQYHNLNLKLWLQLHPNLKLKTSTRSMDWMMSTQTRLHCLKTYNRLSLPYPTLQIKMRKRTWNTNSHNSKAFSRARTKSFLSQISRAVLHSPQQRTCPKMKLIKRIILLSKANW